MSGTELRRVVPGDAAACARVVPIRVGQADWTPKNLPQTEIEEMICEGSPNQDILVSDELVVCNMYVDPCKVIVGVLYCLRAGEGVGNQLLDQVRNGCEYLWLTSLLPNQGALRFLRRDEIIETETAPPTPPDTDSVIRMEWRA